MPLRIWGTGIVSLALNIIIRGLRQKESARAALIAASGDVERAVRLVLEDPMGGLFGDFPKLGVPFGGSP